MTTEAPVSEAYRELARALLARAPGFSDCDVATLDALVRDARLVGFSRGELVVRRGQPFENMLMLVDGILQVGLKARDGRRHILTHVLPGTLFGFMSAVDGGPAPHDAVVHSEAIALLIPAETVRLRRRIDPSLHRAFEVQLALRSRLLYDALSESMLLSLRERLAKQLVQLVDAFGRKKDNHWMINLKLRQADLADLLGAGRQAINAELRELELLGLIRIGRASVDVLDLEALRRHWERSL